MPINYYAYLNIPEESSTAVVRAACKLLLTELDAAERDEALTPLYNAISNILKEINHTLLSTNECKEEYDANFFDMPKSGPEFDTLAQAKALIKTQKEKQTLSYTRHKEIECLTTKTKSQAETIASLQAEIVALTAQNNELLHLNNHYALQTKLLAEQKIIIDDLMRENKEQAHLIKSVRRKAVLSKPSLFQAKSHELPAFSLRFGTPYRDAELPLIHRVIKIITDDVFINIALEFKTEAHKDIFFYRFQIMKEKELAECKQGTFTIASAVCLRDDSETTLTAYFHHTSIFGLIQQCLDRTKDNKFDECNYLMPLLREVLDLDYALISFNNGKPVDVKTLNERTTNEVSLKEITTFIMACTQSANTDVVRYATNIMREYGLINPKLPTLGYSS